MKGKQIGAAVLLTALLLLSACGGEEEADAPHYTVAGMEFPALPTEEEPETEIYGTGDAVTRTYTQFSVPGADSPGRCPDCPGPAPVPSGLTGSGSTIP